MIKKDFLLAVPHPKRGGIVWTCVEDNVVGEKEEYKAIELRGFYYKLFQEEEGEGKRWKNVSRLW